MNNEQKKIKINYIKDGYIYDVTENFEKIEKTDENIKTILDFLFYSGCNFKGDYHIKRDVNQINIFEKNIYVNQKKIEISL